MKIHERTKIVTQAESALREAVVDIIEKHDLTMIEVVDILARALSVWVRNLLRAERHPDEPERSADEA